MSEAKTLSVTRLVRKMRNLLEIELGDLWVEGEVSNLRRQASGHFYFTLKDEGAQVSCVLFRGNAQKVQVEPDNGMQVRLFGEVSVYEARGSVQVIVREVESVGEGGLQAQFEALKRKLDAEGLFAQERKRVLPDFPKKVGIITSGTGAALQDILNVLGRRAPWVQPFLCPVQVQGVGAERGIAKAIQQWSDWEVSGFPEIDVLIVGRGGGSLEDLWNFNEEVVARAMANCSIPLVSAVGHEIDFTIADFVADKRAPTPSAAAEMVSPDKVSLAQHLERYENVMHRCVQERFKQSALQLRSLQRGVLSLSVEKVLREPMLRLGQAEKELHDRMHLELESRTNELKWMHQRYLAVHPKAVLESRLEKVAYRRALLDDRLKMAIEKKSAELSKQGDMLRALGPQSAFERGFSITLTESGTLVRDPKDVDSGQRLVTKLHKGEVYTIVE